MGVALRNQPLKMLPPLVEVMAHLAKEVIREIAVLGGLHKTALVPTVVLWGTGIEIALMDRVTAMVLQGVEDLRPLVRTVGILGRQTKSQHT